MGELKTLLLRHLLNLQRENAQLVENWLHTVGQHAEVLPTDQQA